MHKVSAPLVSDIRSVSRDLVRELGFMDKTLAGTNLPPSAVHAIIEIGVAVEISAKDLAAKLLLEKSTISRLVKHLESSGEIQETRPEQDRRIKNLHLTRQGDKTLARITNFADQQVAGALSRLDQKSQKNVFSALDIYSAALRANRTGPELPVLPARPTIKEGYTPGLIGSIIKMHAAYYSDEAGFGIAFETSVAAGLADFAIRLENPKNAIWHALIGGKIVGSIALDGEDLGDNCAHLRWFIVNDEARGTGVGKSLLQKALDFCDNSGFRETHLWTFKGLDAARALYEKNGFSLADEYRGDQWGKEVLEQKFVRPLRDRPHESAT